MIRTLFFTFLLFTVVAGLYAQGTVKYKGEVRDSTGQPLAFANVVAVDTLTQKMAGFAVTDQSGSFRLNLQKQKVYLLKVSFIGYLPFEGIVEARESNEVPFLITLKDNAQQLDDVEVVAEMPVLIQGDTVTYKAEAFNQGNERKLSDVLENLPGVEVDEDGGVKVQGKSVDKLLVDGKEFFEGDTKLATKNLPANVVDKVQVLQNYNDVGPLSEVNNSEMLAMNIMLKEDKKNIIFGDVTAGAGPEGRYLGHLNSFFYNQKTNINLIADANNIGKPAFNMRDLFRFSGGLNGLSQNSGSSFQLDKGNNGIPMAERNNARDLDNQLAALNFNLTPKKSWAINGFAIGSKIDNTLGSLSERTYVLQSNQQETLSSETRVQSRSALGKVGVKYAPHPSLQVDYNLFGRIAEIDNSSRLLSDFAGNVNDISDGTTQQPILIEQQLRAFYAPDAKNILSLEGSFTYQEQDPTYNLATGNRPFASIISTTGNSPFQLRQVQEVESKKQDAAFNYYRILNKTNHINLKLGNTYAQQALTSELFEVTDEGEATPIAGDQLQNDIDFTYQDFYASLLYKSKWGKLIVTPSLNLHHYQVASEQNGKNNGFDKTLLLPAFRAEYKFRSSHRLNLNYALNTQFRDVNNYAEGILLNSYNSLYRGNADLENSRFHQVSLNYSNFNSFDFLNIYGGVNYQNRINDISQNIAFEGIERVNTPINIQFANEILSGYATVDKKWRAFQLNVSGNWSRSITNNVISDIQNRDESFQQTYRATISSKPWNFLYVSTGYEITLNEYKGTSTSNSFRNHQPFINLTLKFMKGFELKADYQYNQYINDGSNTRSTFDLFDTALSYRKEGSPWEFKVEGMNLFNTTGVRRDSFSQSLLSTYSYFIQKRYWLLSAMFDL